MVNIFAQQGFPGAQELLLKCSRVGLKKRKPFVEIVKETPRQEGETDTARVRRIWDRCPKYDTKCPAVITEELLRAPVLTLWATTIAERFGFDQDEALTFGEAVAGATAQSNSRAVRRPEDGFRLLCFDE